MEQQRACFILGVFVSAAVGCIGDDNSFDKRTIEKAHVEHRFITSIDENFSYSISYEETVAFSITPDCFHEPTDELFTITVNALFVGTDIFEALNETAGENFTLPEERHLDIALTNPTGMVVWDKNYVVSENETYDLTHLLKVGIWYLHVDSVGVGYDYTGGLAFNDEFDIVAQVLEFHTD